MIQSLDISVDFRHKDMPARCAICRENLNRIYYCQKCKGTFHSGCAKFKDLRVKKKVSRCCINCQEEHKSANRRNSLELPVALSILTCTQPADSLPDLYLSSEMAGRQPMSSGDICDPTSSQHNPPSVQSNSLPNMSNPFNPADNSKLGENLITQNTAHSVTSLERELADIKSMLTGISTAIQCLSELKKDIAHLKNIDQSIDELAGKIVHFI